MDGLLTGLQRLLYGSEMVDAAQRRRMQPQLSAQAFNQLLGQRGQQYQQGMGQGMLENRPGIGFLGGQIQPKEFAARMMGIPGYENIGAQLLQQYAPMQGGDKPQLTEITIGGGTQKGWAYPGTDRFVPIGDVTPKGGDIKEYQGKAGLYASRAAESDKILRDLKGKYSPSGISWKTGLEDVWGIGGLLGAGANLMLSPETQKAEQAQRNFINAVLRQESGAVINPDEFSNAQKQYFPQPGDSPEVIKQKAQNRATAIKGLKTMAGGAYQGPSDNGLLGGGRPVTEMSDEELRAIANGR